MDNKKGTGSSVFLHSIGIRQEYYELLKFIESNGLKDTTSGRIHAVTYGQLVDTSSGKLFRLREHLKEHYDALGQESIVELALKEAKQFTMDLK